MVAGEGVGLEGPGSPGKGTDSGVVMMVLVYAGRSFDLSKQSVTASRQEDQGAYRRG